MRHAAVLLAFALAATPAVADDAVLSFMARKLDKPALEGGYSAGLAACLVGKGDVEATAALFTGKGWSREDDSEMGLVHFAAPDGELGAMMGQDGGWCEVASESIGTAEALPRMMPVLAGAGLGNRTGTDYIGCTTFPVASGAVVGITSTGQDPVCESETTSAIRVTFGG